MTTSNTTEQTEATGWANPIRNRNGQVVTGSKGQNLYSIELNVDLLMEAAGKPENRYFDRNGVEKFKLFMCPVNESFVVKEHKPRTQPSA